MSVSNQTYDNWELWLGEFAGNSENQALLKSYSKKDPRIKFKVFKENGGISKNSDAIFKHTKGEFIALLDHDDLLTRDALFENVKLINSGTYDLIYSDKDKISETGVRFDPIFKPDWSPEMMLSANYLTHLNVIRRSKIVEVGGWDSSTDGAQDWDLFLRVADKSTPKKIGHISKVLYHWRTLVTSTALNMSAKPYALEAQCRTVDNHLQRIGAVQGKSYRDQESRMFVEWGVLEQAKPTIIVISRQRDRLTEFVNCVRRHQMEDFKFILVHEDLDVRGVDTSMFTYVDGYKPGHLYSALNQIIDGLDGQVVFMRDTIKVDKGFNEILSQLSGWLQIKGVFAVAPKITDEHGLVTGTGRVRGLASAFGDLFYKTPYVSGVFGSYDWTRNFSALTGKFFMTSSANIKLAGGVAVGVGDMEALDSLFVGAHDAGLRSVYDPLYSIVDLAPFKLELPPSDVMKSLLKKKFESGKDPYYNENLSNLDTSGMLRSGAEGVAKDVALDI